MKQTEPKEVGFDSVTNYFLQTISSACDFILHLIYYYQSMLIDNALTITYE